MKTVYALIPAAFLVLASTASADDFRGLFRPYAGHGFHVRCGESLEQAKSASPQTAVLTLTDSDEDSRILLKGSRATDQYLYLKGIERNHSRYYDSYGGDVGGEMETVKNELRGKVFTQKYVRRSGLLPIWKLRTYNTTLDLSDPSSWIFTQHEVDRENDMTSDTTCLFEPL